jgi:hypothetical protein
MLSAQRRTSVSLGRGREDEDIIHLPKQSVVLKPSFSIKEIRPFFFLSL